MDDNDRQLLGKILKDGGYSVTRPRLRVFELLWGQEPQSMRELQQRAGNSLDRVSLYRTIKLFEQLGIVQRLYIGWKYKLELTDIIAHHHHHISCLECGKVVAITEEQEIEDFIDNMTERRGFKPRRHQLEIQGVCPECV